MDLQELNSYVGKVLLKERDSFHKKMYFICGVDLFKNKLIVLDLSRAEHCIHDYKCMKPDEGKILSVSDAYDVWFSYVEPIVEIHKVYQQFDSFTEDHIKDFHKTMSRMNELLCTISSFENYCCRSFDDETNKKRNEQINKERKKWQKGLRRVKKRTHHYFSDETFDFLIENFKDKRHFGTTRAEHLGSEIEPYISVLQALEKLLS